MPNIRVVVSQFFGLSGNRIGNFLSAVACIHTVKPCESIQKLVTIPIFNIDTAGGLDHPTWAVSSRMLRQMGRRMEKILAVPLIK